MDWIEQAHFAEITGIEKNRDRDRHRAYCEETVEGVQRILREYELKDCTEQVRAVEIEKFPVDIPRWKYGAKLSKRVDREVFGVVFAKVRANKGQYNKEHDCWIFSSEKKRAAFIASLRTYREFPTAPKYTKASEFLDLEHMRFNFDHHLVSIPRKVPIPVGRGYKIEGENIVVDYDNLYFCVEQILLRLNGWVQ